MRMATWVIVITLVGISPTPAMAEKRVALVIGVDRYAQLPSDRQLKKAVNDAHTITTTLRKLGFEVEMAENVDRRTFNRLWARFTSQLGPDDVAAFHFSGHGVELSGANYLIPSDIPNLGESGETLLRDESISLNHLLADLRDKQPRVALVVVDACRNNPLSDNRGRSLGGARGLARAEAPRGSFVIYSAGTGQEALDRLNEADDNPNSVFTRTLAPLLATPGMSLTDIAKQVKGRVRTLALTANHQQTPAYYDEIIGDFYPAGGHGTQPAPNEVTAQREAELTLKEAELRRRDEELALKEKELPKTKEPQVALAAPSTTGPKFVVKQGSWSVYVANANNQRVCFSSSTPIDTQPKNASRGPLYFYVTTWRKDNVHAEVSARLGYVINSHVPPTVIVGSENFKLFARKDKIFTRNPQEEKRLIAAMLNASTLIVKATSIDGAETKDTYSLSGLAASLKKMEQQCQ